MARDEIPKPSKQKKVRKTRTFSLIASKIYSATQLDATKEFPSKVNAHTDAPSAYTV